MKTKIIVLFFLSLLLIGCASSGVSQSVGLIPPQTVIALAPSGGILADAIGIELFNRGFTVVDTQQFSNFMVRHNMTELEFSQAQNLKLIKEEGIDAILMVRSVAGNDQKSQSATVRINSTEDWEKMVGAVGRDQLQIGRCAKMSPVLQRKLLWRC